MTERERAVSATSERRQAYLASQYLEEEAGYDVRYQGETWWAKCPALCKQPMVYTDAELIELAKQEGWEG